MDKSFPFEVDSEYWESLLSKLERETEFDREEIVRGLTFMVGRRASVMLQELDGSNNRELVNELGIAIMHSSEEK